MKGKERLLVDPSVLERAYRGFVGLCLKFNASVEKTIFWEAFKVIYQEDYPVINIMDMGKGDEFRKALLTKSVYWKYEQEGRILKMDEEGGPGRYFFAPELLTGIILGPLMTREDKKILLRWMEAYPTKVRIYQAKLNDKKYQLDINEY